MLVQADASYLSARITALGSLLSTCSVGRAHAVRANRSLASAYKNLLYASLLNL